MRHHLLLSTATIAVAALAANSAHGASILGQSFNLDVSVDGSAVTSVSGTAGGGILTNFAEDQNFVTFGFDVKWVDEDSFDLTIYAPQNAADLTTATISLTGLAFKTPSLQTVDITKATFNPNENNYLGYFFSPENDTAGPRPADPVVTHTANSVTIVYANFPLQAVGDQIPQRFDVQTAVPEPSTSAALIAMVAGGVLLRRKVRHSQGA